MKMTTNYYLPALFVALLLGACSGKDEPAPISTQKAALVQKAATEAVTGLQGQLTAEILAMVSGTPGALLVGDLSSFSVDTSLPSNWGGALAVKGIGSATANSANLNLQLNFDQYTDQAGVILNGAMEMVTQITSLDPLVLTINLKGIFEMIDDAVEEALENIDMELDINVSGVESYVCGLIEDVDISDLLCGDGNIVPGPEVTCNQVESNACASTFNACVAACDPLSGYEVCARQCSVDLCACLELAGCQDAAKNCDPDAVEPLPEDPELPVDPTLPEDMCTQEEANECSSTYSSCVDDCDPLDGYQPCAADCTDEFCSCMADAECKDQTGQCIGQ